jgi:hypothetical protein
VNDKPPLRTEPSPRNARSDGLLSGEGGERGRINGESSLESFGVDSGDLGEVGRVGVRVDDSEYASISPMSQEQELNS